MKNVFYSAYWMSNFNSSFFILHFFHSSFFILAKRLEHVSNAEDDAELLGEVGVGKCE